MKRQSFPLWLLRDVPAFMGFIASFWTLIIFAMVSGRRGLRDDHFALLLAHAEAKLDQVLWRHAYRRLGWPPSLVQLHIIPPTVLWADTLERLANYAHAFRNMNRVVESYVDDLRARYGISERDLVAHGSTDAALCAAAHHALVGAGALVRGNLRPSTCRAEAQLRRKDERGHAHARGPPLNLEFRNPAPPHLSASAPEIAPPRPALTFLSASTTYAPHLEPTHMKPSKPA